MQCVYKRHRPEDFLIQVTVNEQSLFTHARASRWPRVRGTDRLLEGQRFKKKTRSDLRKRPWPPCPLIEFTPRSRGIAARSDYRWNLVSWGSFLPPPPHPAGNWISQPFRLPRRAHVSTKKRGKASVGLYARRSYPSSSYSSLSSLPFLPPFSLPTSFILFPIYIILHNNS